MVRDLTYEVRRYFRLQPDDPGVIAGQIPGGARKLPLRRSRTVPARFVRLACIIGGARPRLVSTAHSEVPGHA